MARVRLSPQMLSLIQVQSPLNRTAGNRGLQPPWLPGGSGSLQRDWPGLLHDTPRWFYAPLSATLAPYHDVTMLPRCLPSLLCHALLALIATLYDCSPPRCSSPRLLLYHDSTIPRC